MSLRLGTFNIENLMTRFDFSGWRNRMRQAFEYGYLYRMVGGQPYRTVFPPGQEVERFPRVGWDRPKASDHCPVVVTLELD